MEYEIDVGVRSLSQGLARGGGGRRRRRGLVQPQRDDTQRNC